jgi:hypothetical protein
VQQNQDLRLRHHGGDGGKVKPSFPWSLNRESRATKLRPPINTPRR